MNLFLRFRKLLKLWSYFRLQKEISQKISAMFFDPLGLICPLVLQVKLLFKEACILGRISTDRVCS